jgi:thiamine-monophosphate kinase
MALGEFELIERYFKRPPRRGDTVLGVGDDAALLRVPPGQLLVAAVDTLVEGRHFLDDAPADSVGHQSLAVNLSDLAAMGAEPAWALLSLSLPEIDEAWLTSFAAGIQTLAARSGIEIVGGDTVRGPLVVTVTVMGFVPDDQALRRSGARPGETLYISGAPGEAAAGLALLRADRTTDPDDVLVRRHRYAEPRIDLGRALRGRASAAMDVSDGLLGDLAKLCAASGVGARVELEKLPLSRALLARSSRHDAERYVLRGGDDYELLFTLPQQTDAAILAGLQALCPVTRIGVIERGSGVLCTRGGVAVDVPGSGYDHFA